MDVSQCRELAQHHAKFILSPCTWVVPPAHDNESSSYGQRWIDAYIPIAKQHSLWIAAVSSVGKLRSGEWAGHHCIGNSMLVSPEGNLRTILPHGRDAEALELIEIHAST